MPTVQILMPWTALISAIIGLGLVFYNAVKGNFRITSAMAALAVVLIFLSHLASIDSFKGLGIEAKMKSNAKESDDILASMKNVVENFSLIAYQSMRQPFGAGDVSQQTFAQLRSIHALASSSAVASRQVDQARQDIINLASASAFSNLYRCLDYQLSFSQDISNEDRGKVSSYSSRVPGSRNPELFRAASIPDSWDFITLGDRDKFDLLKKNAMTELSKFEDGFKSSDMFASFISNPSLPALKEACRYYATSSR